MRGDGVRPPGQSGTGWDPALRERATTRPVTGAPARRGQPSEFGRLLDQLVRPAQSSQSAPSALRPAGLDGAMNAGRLEAPGALRFSAHAQARLKSREIQLGSEQLHRLEAAVSRAAAKGARDSLVLLGDLALVVNIPNRTVITAVDGAHLRDSVFTNIDSAVIG